MPYFQSMEELQQRELKKPLTMDCMKALWLPIVGEDRADQIAANYGLSLNRIPSKS